MSLSYTLQVGRGYISGWLSGRIRRGGIRVYCYHGVVEQKTDYRLERNLHILSDFEDHVELFRRCRMLTVDDLMQELSEPSKNRKPSALITFDDGYSNNLMAAEILSSYKIPWLLFASTASLGHFGVIWTVELSLLILHGESTEVETLGSRWPLTNRPEREAAFQAIRSSMKAMSSGIRKSTMQEVRSQFPREETARLLKRFSSLQMLTWDEIGQLSTAGVEVGSHGVDHEIHHSNQESAVRMVELADSKRELESRLNRPCRCFAYPNGNTVSTSPAEARTAGYQLGFTTDHGTVNIGSNQYLLPRLEPGSALNRLVSDFFWERQIS